MANESVKVGDEILITEYDDEYVSTVAKVTEFTGGFDKYFYATYVSGDELETYGDGQLLVTTGLDKYVILTDMAKSSKNNIVVDEFIELLSNLAQTVAKQERKIEALRHKTDYSDNLLLDRIEALEERQERQDRDISISIALAEQSMKERR